MAKRQVAYVYLLFPNLKRNIVGDWSFTLPSVDFLPLSLIHSDIGTDDCRELRDILGTLVADVLPALIPSSTQISKVSSLCFLSTVT